MHTPPQSASKGPRRSSKQHQNKDMAQRSVQSDNDAYHASSQAGNQTPSKNINHKAKKKSHNQKHGGAVSEAGEYSDGIPQRNAHYIEKTKATPIKSQAYAGPTFHQSPAASALPMPSFYSRSVPDPGHIDPISEPVAKPLMREQKQTSGPNHAEGAERQSTPLDFLFNAAREAKTPRDVSPAHRQVYLSPGIPSPASRSPGIRDMETDFPFELESPSHTPREAGSGTSTPFKDRLEAARSPMSTAEGGQNMTEEERRIKTAALKKALMNPQGLNELTKSFRDTNPFNARNASPVQPIPQHHTPNQSAPHSLQDRHTVNNPYVQPISPRPISPNRNNNIMPLNGRPASSGLRNVYKPDPNEQILSQNTNGELPTARRISTAPQPNFSSIYGDRKQTEAQQPNVQQGLHDLRKVLNLDLMGRG